MSYFRRPWFEFKAVPSKGKVYRYWYLRWNLGGRERSFYVGADPNGPRARQAVKTAKAEIGRARFREPNQQPGLGSADPGSLNNLGSRDRRSLNRRSPR